MGRGWAGAHQAQLGTTDPVSALSLLFEDGSMGDSRKLLAWFWAQKGHPALLAEVDSVSLERLGGGG